jgi:hypothetical protein
VLRAHGVFVADNGDGKTFSLMRGDFVEVQILEGMIQPKRIRYFWRKLQIPIHHFWHPEEAEKDAELRVKAGIKTEARKEDENDEALE